MNVEGRSHFPDRKLGLPNHNLTSWGKTKPFFFLFLEKRMGIAITRTGILDLPIQNCYH